MNQQLIDLLKNARLQKGLKQEEVANVLGVKKNTISNYETGKSEPDIDSFITMCNIYGIDYANAMKLAYGNNSEELSDSEPITLSHKILHQKNKLNLKSEDIASQADVPIGTLNKILTGETKNPTAKTTSKIARVLGVSTEYLLNDFIPIEPKIEDLLSGDELQQKKAPNSEDSESEAEIEKLAILLYEGLLDAGFIEEGQDLTSSQIDFLDGLAAIISAFFDKRN